MSDDLIECFACVQAPLRRTHDLLGQQFASLEPDVASVLTQIGSRRGKMLRPGLLFLAAGMHGPINDGHIRAAALLETIHCASLVHDDVLDGGRIRRGRRTPNALFGNKLSILLGDLYISLSLRMFHSLGSGAAQVISDAVLSMCQGEIRQNIHCGNFNLSQAQYFSIIHRKTAALFQAAAALPAVMADADVQIRRRLAAYGTCIGITYQMADDLCDIIGDENAVHKTLGTDSLEQKITLPVVRYLSLQSMSDKPAAIERLKQLRFNRQLVRDLLLQTGCIEYSIRQIRRFTHAAKQCLAGLPDGQYRSALDKFPDLIAGNLDCSNLQSLSGVSKYV